MSCSDAEPPEAKLKTDWVAEEILLQLAELRKEVKSLKGDLAQLDARIGSAGAARFEGGPQQVQLSSDLVLGNANAKLAIVEFTDYQCPYCARHYKSVLPEIKEKLIDTGKAKYVMYDFPLGFHAQAKPAAVAARCAGVQGKYWEMHDAIFSNQSTLGPSLYESAAKELALDQASLPVALTHRK